MQSFVHGLILALGLILPLGVQNLFVFNQGANQPGFLRALPAIFTAAVCDTLLIILAVQGVSLFLMKFGFFKMILIGMGVLFLCYMGWITWNHSGIRNAGEGEAKFTVKQQILFAITVSLLNPHAVLDTIGVIGTSSIHYSGQEKGFFTAACILVSWVWFFFLAALGRMIGRQSQSHLLLTGINKVSAIFMWGSALYMVYMAVVV